MATLKDTLKNCKSVKNSDEILDELFSSIKDENESSVENSENDNEDTESSDEEKERKKHKKSKKKKKKHKKKKKKHKRSDDHSEEREEKPSKKLKKEKSDSFWGDDKPFELKDENRGKVSNGEARRDRERDEYDSRRERDDYDRKERDEYERRDYERDSRSSYSRSKPEYTDERRPVDLGREARPYPTGVNGHAPSYKSSRERSEHFKDDYHERSRNGEYYRESYDRDKWERREYDRDRRDPRDYERDRRDPRDYERDRRDPRDRDRRDYQYEREDRRDYERDERRDYDRDSRRDRDEYNKLKERAKESYKPVKEVEKRRGRSRSGSKESANGEGGGDTFWDSKWDGMQLDDKLRKAEYKGRYYLNTKKRYDDTMGDKARGTPSLSPSPERVDKSKEEEEKKKKKKDSDSDSDTEEFKRLKEMRDVQNFKVTGDGMVEGPIADSSNFEYDPVTRMYRKKDGMVELEVRRMNKDDKKDDDEKVKDEDNKSDDEDKENKPSNKEEIMDELVKEIEELENEVEVKEEDVKVGTSAIDWGSSALSEILTEKEKEERKKKKEEEKRKKEEEKKRKKEEKKRKEEEEKKMEDGELSDNVEDGEISSGDEKRRQKYTRSKRSRSRERRRSYSRGDRYSSSRSYRRRSRSYSRDRDRDRERYSRRRSRSPYDRERYSRRKYSRSRSRSRERRAREAEERYERMKRKQERHNRSKINKEKLLEIAKKNANKILKAGGDFMGMDQDRLISMKAGGSSLDELTKFCKELAKKGLEDGDRIDLLAESESDSEEEFHHPFMVKDKPLPNPITMLIGEAKETLTPAARAVAKSARMLEFPVSSGNAHRTKEGDKPAAAGADGLPEWQSVDTSSTLPELARPALELQKDEEEEMIKFHEQIEQEEKELREAASNTLWSLNEEDKDIMVPKGKDFFKPAEPEIELDEKQMAEIEKLKPKPSELAAVLSKANLPLALPAPKLTPDAGDVAEPVSQDPNKVFDTVAAPVVDIGTIVSRRLNAMRMLQKDPNDAQALAEMYDAQQMMSDWASSKNKPGQFVGSTGAKVMSKGELNLGLQCWAKAEQFNNAEKVKGGFGEFMLKKMGWKDGEGLGRFKSGDVNPLTLDIKFDKKGLMAAEETKRKGDVVTMHACKDLSGKHPVSALTELCSKRRWGPPIFTQAFECGPPHKKQYVFKVNVNGNDYMPSVAVDNKKKAKANAAMACLQQMGLVPKDPDNPV